MTPPRYDFRTAPLAIDLYCGLGGWTSGQKSKVLALFNALSAAQEETK